jgi:UDP-N-acetylglucosamine--dolichyl-phosphate N-acetylglucosaminephosphotransferase
MEILLFISVFIGICLTLLFLPKWIKKCGQIGLLWEDMNKFGHPKNVAASGGIVVVMSFISAVLLYVAMRTFYLKDINGISLQILSLLAVILIMALVGITDDFLGWRHGGLSWKFRIFLAFFASIPLVVINAGHHTMNFPIWGELNLGIIYPLIFIPIGIAGATTTYNFLAGFNGLEAGQGIIILSFLSFVSYLADSAWLSIVGLCMVFSLIVFYF